ncbi:hypothetical protein [Tenacibaculum singaporense]|uniref:GAPS4b N-terminal domain-containing protein n=1 Tax=Tenacibaculum singaporense TaxID=2358479 RepID=A0A3Q8RT03_9FLAO|nr:hypothetical protein [Tenacibaculum singaporense]AZJ36874.1 hypothetical protein D6T69_15545 [Tenacibaculum singaporense]
MKKDFLPQGDFIRQLLIKSNISGTSISKLLREKGVYTGINKKNSSVPLLMKSIISPTDYEELRETQKTKEETLKYRTSSIKCNDGDFDLSKILSGSLDLNSKIIEKHTYKPNYKVIGSPSFYFEDSQTTAIIEYKIERENILNDWTENKTTHIGAVTLKKMEDGDIQISVQQNSTSKETLEVNSIIIGKVKEALRTNSIVSPKQDFISIKFRDFDNDSRINFFKSFIENFSLYLNFKSITDVDLFIDSEISSHKDVEKFLQELDNLKLNGKGLENHILLSNKDYYPSLIFSSLKLRYSLEYRDVRGTVAVVLSFPEYLKSKDLNSELQISIDILLSKEDRKKKIEKVIRKKLLEHIEKKKVESYSTFKNSPNP